MSDDSIQERADGKDKDYWHIGPNGLPLEMRLIHCRDFMDAIRNN